MYRGKLLDFYHNQFRESAEAEYLYEDSERKLAHKRLADYFYNQACSFRDGILKEQIPRGFSELLFHLKEAGKWHTIIACIKDPGIFDKIPPPQYNVNIDSGVYVCPASDALVPDSLSSIPVEQRSTIAFGIASAFADRARDRIQQAEQFDKPWKETAKYLTEHDIGGFCVYRDVFYSFIRLAGKAAEYAKYADECSINGNNSKAEFIHQNKDIRSFLHFIFHFGYEVTGLSHAIEDDAFPSYRTWENL